MAVTHARGFRAGTAACGIKAFTAGASAIPSGQKDDLCVVHSELPCDTGGVFTTNKVKSASVVIDQLHLEHNRVHAVTVNSGNANACTGAQGFKDALLMAKLSADRLDLDPNQVLVSSTGVIGRQLPMNAIKFGIAEACERLSADGGPAAALAILTTDKFKGVRCVLAPAALKISSTNTDQEEAQEEAEIAYKGDAIDIGFNVTYLLDVLNHLKVDKIKISLGDANSSALITGGDNADFKYVVMPMRI